MARANSETAAPAEKADEKPTKKNAEKMTAKTSKKSTERTSKRPTAKASKKSTARAARRPRKTNGRVKPSVAVAAWNRYEIPERQQFFLCSGQRLRNIEELADVLDEMQKEVFEYHVNSERNDIHAWVKHVFREDALADDLLGAGDARQMREIIRRYAPEGA